VTARQADVDHRMKRIETPTGYLLLRKYCIAMITQKQRLQTRVALNHPESAKRQETQQIAHKKMPRSWRHKSDHEPGIIDKPLQVAAAHSPQVTQGSTSVDNVWGFYINGWRA